uniref:TFIIS N-terminal domain-containing protein n=1 Tax=Oryza brachyantha TaxID=4533 RepID=J3MNH7_ORYBR
MAPSSMDYWLGFFRGAGDNIFDAIDAAITVAASAHPAALRSRRDAIAERLYTAHLASRAPGAPPQLPHPEGAASVPSLCSSDRAEVITDDGGVVPRREDPVAAETERIKAVLLNDQEKSEAALLELLQRLQQLELTVDTLTVTEIGKAVSSYRKHSSKPIRHLVRLLIEGWKCIVDEWMSSRDAIVDHTPQSMHPSGLERHDRGLTSPSMDDGALFATPSTSIRLSEENQGSKFFDGTDDDGSMKSNSGKDNSRMYTRNQEPARRPLPPMTQQYDPDQSWKQEQSAMRQSRPQELSNGQTREQFIATMLARPSNPEPVPGRTQPRPKQHQDASPAQGKSLPFDKPASHHDENSVRAKLELAKNAKLELSNNAKLEVTKRKLQEGYQEFDNAKKLRTVQVVDPQNLPKQGNRNWQPNGKPRNNSNLNNNRNWSR